MSPQTSQLVFIRGPHAVSGSLPLTCGLDRSSKADGRSGWHCEEVEGRGHLAVVLKEDEPSLARVAAAVDTPEIPCDDPFRDVEAQLLNFPVDFVSAPAGVLLSHSADKRADLVSDSGPTVARARSPSRVEEKTSPPADNSLGVSIISVLDQRGQTRRSVVQKSRPKDLNIGRGRLRLITATC